MSSVRPLRPLPVADAITAGFWEGAKRGELHIQRCGRCATWQHPPGIVCRSCGSTAMGFEPVSGRATLYSWTILHDAPAPGFASMLPLILGVVELPEQEHLLIGTNIVDADEASLRIGMTLEAVFEQIEGDATLVQFRPARDH